MHYITRYGRVNGSHGTGCGVRFLPGRRVHKEHGARAAGEVSAVEGAPVLAGSLAAPGPPAADASHILNTDDQERRNAGAPLTALFADTSQGRPPRGWGIRPERGESSLHHNVL
jgi:hypothetical protein